MLVQGLGLAAIGVSTDRRGFVPVNENMQVLDEGGKPVPHVYCIGDANGKTQELSFVTCTDLRLQAMTSGHT